MNSNYFAIPIIHANSLKLALPICIKQDGLQPHSLQDVCDRLLSAARH